MFDWLKHSSAAGPADPEPFGHLRPRRNYRVVRSFVDHDGLTHPVGKTSTFLRSTFLPYEDGLSLFVATPEGSERQIRLQRLRQTEGPLIDSLHESVLPASGDAGCWTLPLTRDSVCMADDMDAPHAFTLDVERDADAASVARAVLAADYPAWVGREATWSLTLGTDPVLFGYRNGLRFVRPLICEPISARAEDVDRLHLSYLAQADPAAK